MLPLLNINTKAVGTMQFILKIITRVKISFFETKYALIQQICLPRRNSVPQRF